ncbi:MAG TPA: UvrD-helicase domain-containing protein [bacterium]|nr:UvrD-helicase domain-containing protein [bacterium]
MSFDLSSLNDEQRAAVTATQGALLVLAGAGSGKTRVITTRIAYLVRERRVPPEQILALTFTNKAAREMAERVSRLLKGHLGKGEAERPTVSTFHSFGVRLLRAHIEKLGYRPQFVIFDSQDQQQVVKGLLEEGGYDIGGVQPKDVYFALQNAKSRGVTPDELLSHSDSPMDQQLGRLLGEYNEMLKRLGAIDFEDILLLSLRLCREHPAAAQDFFSRYRYVQVDEYQDTNRAQYDMLKAIVKQHGNLCVVGDDDQSIYRWRGAEPGNILEFERDFAGARVVRLEQNYRSSANILAAANQVIRNNTVRKSKTLRTLRDAGRPLEWLLAEEEREELEKVVTHLKLTRLREGGTWADFAILYRSNHQSRAVEELLREEGIPYQLVGGTRFYERKEVKDALAYLRLVHQPHDEVSLLRVLNFPRRGIGKTSQMRLMDLAGHQKRPAFEILREATHYADFGGAVGTAMERFAGLIDAYRRRFEAAPLGPTFRELLAEVGVHRAVEKERKDAKGAERAVGLIYELELALDQFGQRTGRDGESAAGVKDFLEHVALLTLPEEPEKGERTPQVTLMTVHSAKGLEFPCVYLINLAEDVFPNKRSLAEDGDEEERRLFYVAVTRAQRQLVFSMGRVRKRYGEVIRQQPSRFLLEIEPNLFDGPAPATDYTDVAAQQARKTESAKARFFEQMRRMKHAAQGD